MSVEYNQPPGEVIVSEPVGPNIAHESSNFTIGLFEIGDCKSCAYSWFCCWCAKAEARSNMDGSGCLFNFFCMKLAPLRLIKYGNYQLNY